MEIAKPLFGIWNPVAWQWEPLNRRLDERQPFLFSEDFSFCHLVRDSYYDDLMVQELGKHGLPASNVPGKSSEAVIWDVDFARYEAFIESHTAFLKGFATYEAFIEKQCEERKQR